MPLPTNEMRGKTWDMTTFEIPEFIRPDNQLTDQYSVRRLSRQAQSGDLHRVRRGLYLPSSVWNSLKHWEKYRMEIQAVHELAVSPPVFARESAAEIMKLPFTSRPEDVQTVVKRGGSGGQSSAGVHRIGAIDGDPPPWNVSGLLMTPPPQTARDLAVRLPFADSLAAMDRVLHPKAMPNAPVGPRQLFTRQDVIDSIELLPNHTQRTRAGRVLEYADGLSQSPGESKSRAIMILNGFPVPALQVPFSDSQGRIGFPDFDWEEFKILGEFDGFEKYSAQRYLKGKTPSEVVVEEKRREDRLRAKGYKVVRWIWTDIQYPGRLVRLLREAGLPVATPRA